MFSIWCDCSSLREEIVSLLAECYSTNQEWRNGVLGNDNLHCNAILGRGQTGLMRWIKLGIMPLVPDWSLDLLTSSPACYHCSTAAPTKQESDDYLYNRSDTAIAMPAQCVSWSAAPSGDKCLYLRGQVTQPPPPPPPPLPLPPPPSPLRLLLHSPRIPRCCEGRPAALLTGGTLGAAHQQPVIQQYIIHGHMILYTDSTTGYASVLQGREQPGHFGMNHAPSAGLIDRLLTCSPS